MTNNTCNHSSNRTPVLHSQGAKTGRIALPTTENPTSLGKTRECQLIFNIDSRPLGLVLAAIQENSEKSYHHFSLKNIFLGNVEPFEGKHPF